MGARPATLLLLCPVSLGLLLVAAAPNHPVPAEPEPFLTGDRCIACHKGVTTPEGEDVSIGYDWRASMMANSARDPYWQAAVRREILDHPEARAAIEDKCSRCHMPIANELARTSGGLGSVFANLPGADGDETTSALAMDGVTCSVCHQIESDGLGTESSFVGGFVVGHDVPEDGRPVYGPFEPDEGGTGIMHSATGFRPTEGTHVQTSALCASCHTLFTHSVTDGVEGSEFPEQVPFLEWQASDYGANDQSCQSCHMPEVASDVPVTGVLGRSRPDVSRHVFRGGNFFMLRMLNRYRGELGVTALPQELELAAERTIGHLREGTADVAIGSVSRSGREVSFEVTVRNRAGHKFPTAYPSRRAWLHVEVVDAAGRTLFESGAFSPDGRISGNDHDEDGGRFEPHHDEITSADQVQVYEAVMADRNGAVTTGLMSAERWLKDNRLLPTGFAAARSDRRIGVYGAATDDGSFAGGQDVVRYRVDAGGATGPVTVRVALWFQPIAYRWAQNLAAYDAPETERFVRFYDAMASRSAVVIARGEAEIR